MVAAVNFEIRAINRTDDAFGSFHRNLIRSEGAVGVLGERLKTVNTGMANINRRASALSTSFNRASTAAKRLNTEATGISRSFRTLPSNFTRAGRGARGLRGSFLQILQAVTPLQLGMAGLGVGALGVGRAFLSAADSFTMYRSQLRTVAEEGQSVEAILNDLRIASNNSLAALDGSVLLYQRLSQALDGTGAVLRGITCLLYTSPSPRD